MGTRAPAELWELTEHCCRVCFGRILRSAAPGDDGLRRWRCACCGAEALHHAVTSVCACGMRQRTGRDMGLRCQRNQEPRPEMPSEILAVQAEV